MGCVCCWRHWYGFWASGREMHFVHYSSHHYLRDSEGSIYCSRWAVERNTWRRRERDFFARLEVVVGVDSPLCKFPIYTLLVARWRPFDVTPASMCIR